MPDTTLMQEAREIFRTHRVNSTPWKKAWALLPVREKSHWIALARTSREAMEEVTKQETTNLQAVEASLESFPGLDTNAAHQLVMRVLATLDYCEFTGTPAEGIKALKQLKKEAPNG